MIHLVITHSLYGAGSLHSGSVIDYLRYNYEAAGTSLYTVGLTEARVWFAYLSAIVDPFFHRVPFVKAETLSSSFIHPWTTLLALAGCAVLIGISLKCARNRPIVAFSLLFFIITLLPESFLNPRYLFCGYRCILPMAGVLLLVGYAAVLLLQWNREMGFVRRLGVWLGASALLVIALFGTCTFSKADRWMPIDLWAESYSELPELSDQVEKMPYLDVIMNYSAALLISDNPLKVLDIIERAFPGDRTAIVDRSNTQVRPNSSVLHRDVATENGSLVNIPPQIRSRILVNYGQALKRMGNLKEAANCFRRSLEFDIGSVWGHISLGLVLEEQGEFQQALTHYATAVKLAPNSPEAHFNYGNALARTMKLSEAVSCYRTSIRLEPNHSRTHLNLGYTLMALGDFSAARKSLRTAEALGIGDAQLFNAIGVCFATEGLKNDARKYFERALLFDRAYEEARINLRILGEAVKDSE